MNITLEQVDEVLAVLNTVLTYAFQFRPGARRKSRTGRYIHVHTWEHISEMFRWQKVPDHWALAEVADWVCADLDRPRLTAEQTHVRAAAVRLRDALHTH